MIGQHVIACSVHGDYVPANVVLDPDGLKVNGILDWESARACDLPALDLAQLILAVRMLVRRREFGEVVLDALAAGWTEDEQVLLATCSRRRPAGSRARPPGMAPPHGEHVDEGPFLRGQLVVDESEPRACPDRTRMTNRSPSVSVVICTYASERFHPLLSAFDSVRRQSRQPAELAVVVDHNPALLRRVRGAAPDVLTITNEEARGLSGARNCGISATRGAVVAFLDDDAFAESDWLERLVAPYADPDVVGVGGAILAELADRTASRGFPTSSPGWSAARTAACRSAEPPYET